MSKSEHLRIYILTDLEGPAGIASWEQTRVKDSHLKHIAMELLTREVNACVDGILVQDPHAEIVVVDGHGSGGLDIRLFHEKAKLIYRGPLTPPSGLDSSFDALFYVGQHAMAGTPGAPLCHTYSSLNIEHYILNGEKIGEIGCRVAVAGLYDVPLAFLAGDDKACLEAQRYSPNMVTVATKQGMDIELALHLSPTESCRRIRAGAAQACTIIDQLQPYTIPPPYRLEIRVREGVPLEPYVEKYGARKLDERTVLIMSGSLLTLPI